MVHFLCHSDTGHHSRSSDNSDIGGTVGADMFVHDHLPVYDGHQMNYPETRPEYEVTRTENIEKDNQDRGHLVSEVGCGLSELSEPMVSPLEAPCLQSGQATPALFVVLFCHCTLPGQWFRSNVCKKYFKY